MSLRTTRSWSTVGRAAAVAGVVSGAPSTLHSLITGRPILATARAAGTLLGRATLTRGALAHTVITGGWTVVLAAVLPRRHTAWWGAAAGLAIGVLDLEVARRRSPEIARLPRTGQLADHVAFGLVAGAVLGRRERA